MPMVAVNRADGSVIRSYEETSPQQVDEAIEAAHRAHLDWKRTPFETPPDLMMRAGGILRARAREFGE